MNEEKQKEGELYRKIEQADQNAAYGETETNGLFPTIKPILEEAKAEIMAAANEGPDMAVQNNLWDALIKWFGANEEEPAQIKQPQPPKQHIHATLQIEEKEAYIILLTDTLSLDHYPLEALNTTAIVKPDPEFVTYDKNSIALILKTIKENNVKIKATITIKHKTYLFKAAVLTAETTSDYLNSRLHGYIALKLENVSSATA